MQTAEYIVKHLEELGINEFFGLPGDYNFNILYAIENNPNTKWIGCTNELNAGYAADGYARIRGYGALVTTYGVGELSAINAIAGCMAENVPVIHLVGLPSTKNIESKKLIHHNFQNVDYQNFINAYKNVTAASAFLTKDNAKIEIDRIFKTLIREKKPVYLAIPEDIALMEISDKVIAYDWISDKNTLDELSLKIANKINNSQNPVIIGDILVKRFNAELEYKEFVYKSGIPTTNFLMGTNLIDMESENYMGSFLGEQSNPIIQQYVVNTDCLIAVGPIYSDLNSFGQTLPYKIENHIAIYGTYTYFEGKCYDNVKMADLLETVTNLIGKKEIKIESVNLGLKPPVEKNEAISSLYIYARLQDFIKENDIIIAETGTIPYGIVQLKFSSSVEILTQNLWGSIGWATPATLGACLAKTQSRVILISGEGAHQITAMEIGNILRQGLKPIIIIINNNGYTTERLLSNNPQDNFNDIVQMNYAKFARVFDGDIWATKVSTTDDFDKALRVTQIMNKLCYIEISTDSLDTPNIVKEFINKLKEKNNKINISETNVNNIYNTQKELTLSNTDEHCKYETIVHRALDINDQQEEESL